MLPSYIFEDTPRDLVRNKSILAKLHVNSEKNSTFSLLKNFLLSERFLSTTLSLFERAIVSTFSTFMGQKVGLQHSFPNLSHAVTWFNIGAWDGAALVPSRQQLENNLNQKAKPIHNINLGWEHIRSTQA